MLDIFAESMEFIRQRKPDWLVVRFHGDSLRLFAGRLIVQTLHREGVWLAATPAAAATLSALPSWLADTRSYPAYRRVPSTNGYYRPAMDMGNDWPVVRRAHLAYLEQALSPGVAPDHRSVVKHDGAVVEFLTARTPSQARAEESTAAARAQTVADGAVSFTHAEMFPLIARLILAAARDRPGQFVAHDALVTMVLADATGASLVVQARAKSAWTDERSAASNMVAWFSQQISVGRSQWVQFFERTRVDGAWAYRPVTSATPSAAPEGDFSALEGEPRMFFHLRRERDAQLVRAKREASRNADGELECEACGFVAERVYGALAGEVCETHHRTPIGDAVESVETRLVDLAILCPNCHRAIHQIRPMPTVEEFRARLGQPQFRPRTGSR
jgi:hypothetical protein